MFELTKNYVKIAVARLCGPTKAANAVAVSGTTVHHWIKRGRIVDVGKATLMARLSGLELQQLRRTL